MQAIGYFAPNLESLLVAPLSRIIILRNSLRLVSHLEKRVGFEDSWSMFDVSPRVARGRLGTGWVRLKLAE